MYIQHTDEGERPFQGPSTTNMRPAFLTFMITTSVGYGMAGNGGGHGILAKIIVPRSWLGRRVIALLHSEYISKHPAKKSR
ncbi:MAG: hypothetical protein WAK17_08125 [Candidatus Nitrosopolaris sp.]